MINIVIIYHTQKNVLKWLFQTLGIVQLKVNTKLQERKSTYIYGLKGLSHEIDFKNFDKNLQNLV
jgi:hypothetical protein